MIILITIQVMFFRAPAVIGMLFSALWFSAVDSHGACLSSLLERNVPAGYKFEETELDAAELRNFSELHPRFAILKHNGYALIAKDEEIGKKIVQDIIAWKKSLGEETTLTEVFPRLWNGYDLYEISEVLPSFALETIGKVTGRVWGNCWGTTCHAAGLKAAPVFASDRTMNYWLESSLAKEISEKDLLPGDLVVYRDQTQAPEVHAAIFISTDLVYQKTGITPGPVRLQDFAEMHSYYRRNRLKFFRIASVKDFIRQHESELSKVLKETLDQIDLLEGDYFKFGSKDANYSQVVNSSLTSPSDEASTLKQLRNRVNALVVLVSGQLNLAPKNPAEGFLWQALQYRLFDL